MPSSRRNGTEKQGLSTTLGLALATGSVACLGFMAVLMIILYARTNPTTPVSAAGPGAGRPQPAVMLSAPPAARVTPSFSPTPFQAQKATLIPTVSPSAAATAERTTTASPSATGTPPPTLTAWPTATQTPTETPTQTATPTNTPLPSPTPEDGLPVAAIIAGVTGHAQALPLSCEARSAVDWARFFGVTISEMDFQNLLPRTDNPNTGFVGDPADERGGMPPDSYGVYPPPVARLLRMYGLRAKSYANYNWRDLRAEIAAGRPVIAWVIGNTWQAFPGEGVPYTASDSETMTVAAYEHTVIVIGYGPGAVTVVDNEKTYSVPLEQFLSSWGEIGRLVIAR